MMIRTIIKLLFGSCLLLLGCQSDDETIMVVAPPAPEVNEVPTVIPTGNEHYLNEPSDYIFDQQTLHTFELKLPAAALARLDADPAAEVYEAGSLIFNGDTISPVGIRYKGSVGAFVGCLSNPDWANPSGYKTCTKLSMKVKINWEGREEQFYKLKKLQFHSQNLDDSQMRERLGYWLFREMDVPAPRSVHARLVVNGEYVGLFALTEQIDGRMMRYNFDDGKGNLYKEIWPLQMNGQPYSEQAFINQLETNEDENPSAALIRNFGQAVANANEADLQSTIATWMHIPEILSYAVVDRTIRHDDGPFHWYCNGGNCTNHNYFWYEETESEKLHLIPWDLDNAFENIIYNANPVTPVADDWGETTANCQPFTFGALQLQQWSAGCDKLTGGWMSFTEEYETLLELFKNGPLSESAVNAQLDAWTAQVRSSVIEANAAHGDANSEAIWNNAVDQLKAQVKFAREH